MLTFANGYSPVLSVLTGTFEVAVAVWALAGPGRKRILQPVAALLIFLAGYQFIEALVCANPGVTAWARLAFMDVVWLPPLSLWLLVQYAAPHHQHARWAGAVPFLIAAFFTGWIAVHPSYVTGTVCGAVIATYTHPGSDHFVYGALYEAGLFLTVFLGIKAIVDVEDPVLRRHAADLVTGTVGFMLPAFVSQLILKQINDSIPSLMCHYALILGVMLWRTTARERRASVA